MTHFLHSKWFLPVLIIAILLVAGILIFSLPSPSVSTPSTGSATSTATSSASTGSVGTSGGNTSANAGNSGSTKVTPIAPDGSNWQQGFVTITAQDNNKTIILKKSERFVIQLGGAETWKLQFTPDGRIDRVPNSTTQNGIEGVYEALSTGTVTLSATGSPICNPGEACPMYVQVVTVHLNIIP